MILSSVILLLIVLIILGVKSWIIRYIKILKTYRDIPCPPNRLPLLGNLLNLPLNPHRKMR
jgi:hypothetical protein